MSAKQPAIILLGPTGSGKSPLGDQLQQRGWNGRASVHFDFGANLRSLVERCEPDAIVSADDISFLREVLDSGVLLEDEDFPIAQRVLASFLQSHDVTPSTIVVMNGLPRHAGQSQALTGMLEVIGVILLECSAGVVLDRIAADTGGDRFERTDDDLSAVENKLRIYAARTAPLAQFYRDRGIPIMEIEVTSTMTSATMWELVQQT